MSAILSRILANPTGRIGLVLVVLVVLAGALAPWLAPYPPAALDVANRFSGPTAAHLLGTDQLGRDLLSRLLLGTRTALVVALTSIAVAFSGGMLLGIAAAYLPARAERLVLIVFDIISSFPSLVLALAIVALFGPGLEKIVLIVAVTLIPHFGRVARAQTLSLKSSPFLEAERVLGASPTRMVLVHILPNIIGPMVVLASMDIPVVITIEAGLSFLGVGVPPPAPSWGTLLNDGYAYLDQTVWIAIFAGLALTLATLGFTLFGEALRDAIDPRLKVDHA
jgi:peptide/nickel transport system permease protein